MPAVDDDDDDDEDDDDDDDDGGFHVEICVISSRIAVSIPIVWPEKVSVADAFQGWASAQP